MFSKEGLTSATATLNFNLSTMADALKAEGNKAFSAKDYDRAIDLFSKALDLDQSNFVLWSNRSAAKAGKRDWDGALADADQVRTPLSLVSGSQLISPPGLQCISVNPTWAKGYARKGAALHGQRRYVEAIDAYELGLKIEDGPALRKGLEEVKAAKGACHPPPIHFSSTLIHGLCDYSEADERGDGAEALGFGKMFSDPSMLAKLAANPRTAKHLADVSFMQKVCVMCAPPKVLAPYSLLPAPAHTAEPPTSAEPAQQRSAHDRCSRSTHGHRHAGLQSARRFG